MNNLKSISFQALKIDTQNLKKPEITEKYQHAESNMHHLIDNLDRRGLDIQLTSALSDDFVCLNVLDKQTDEIKTCITPGINANPINALSQIISKAFDILLNKQ